MRLFIAIDLPPDAARNLEDLLGRLRPAAQIQWSPLSNLHVTTKFIGEWPDPRLPELISTLAALPPSRSISVRLRRVGFFPNPHAPRIFWCGVESPGLPELAATTDLATFSLGIPRETHPFSPHVTLARIRSQTPLQPLREAVAALPSLEFGGFAAHSFFLYRSVMQPSGSVYTKLAEFPLTKP
jgi:2'-5' RNA ligase